MSMKYHPCSKQDKIVENITLVSWKPGMAPGNGTRNQVITANQFLGLRDVDTPLTPTSENA